jgi:uncharacterized phage-associated protein
MYRTLQEMPVSYREDRATQAAARLIELHGGSMNVMKLIKLLYFLDRTALIRWGRPITFDFYFSLNHGPILSVTLNNIDAQPGPYAPTYWSKFIGERRGYDVELVEKAPMDQLSPAEESLVNEIFDTYGGMDQWQLSELSHRLPEWMYPEGSNRPIAIEDILRGEDFSEEEVANIVEGLEAEGVAQRLLA